MHLLLFQIKKFAQNIVVGFLLKMFSFYATNRKSRSGQFPFSLFSTTRAISPFTVDKSPSISAVLRCKGQGVAFKS
jgi:hypothetical protein